MVKIFKTSVKIGLIQTAVSDDIEANLKKTARFIQQAARKGAKIVCLQELFATKYFAQTENKKHFKLAESIPGRISRFLSETAWKSKVTLVGGSLFEHGEGRKY